MRKAILALSLTGVLLIGGTFSFFGKTKATPDEVNDISEPETPYTVIEAWKEEEPILISEKNYVVEERLATWIAPEKWVNRANDYQEAPLVYEMVLTDEEVKLIARMTMAEAEGESELGKRLVIDTILNRVDSEHFPNTVYGVLFQPHQFSPIESGRWDRCWAREDICELVLEECVTRQNYECLYFQRASYCSWGVWMLKEGNHNFFGYKG